MKKALITAGLCMFLLSACGGGENIETVKSMQRKDKNLSCKEVLLEMNEAEFYKRMANEKRGPKLKNILMPLGYVSTYMDAGDAVGAAEARVAYLDRIYEILDCENQQSKHMPVFGGAVPYSQYDESAAQGSAGMNRH